MRCEDCQHWKHDPISYWGEGFGLCTRITLPDHIYDTSPADYSYDMKKKYVRAKIREAGAYVQDSSNYHANLFTMPDFFCARFEQKS